MPECTEGLHLWTLRDLPRYRFCKTMAFVAMSLEITAQNELIIFISGKRSECKSTTLERRTAPLHAKCVKITINTVPRVRKFVLKEVHTQIVLPS